MKCSVFFKLEQLSVNGEVDRIITIKKIAMMGESWRLS